MSQWTLSEINSLVSSKKARKAISTMCIAQFSSNNKQPGLLQYVLTRHLPNLDEVVLQMSSLLPQRIHTSQSNIGDDDNLSYKGQLDKQFKRWGWTAHSQCIVMAYVTDTPSQQLDSYIILTLANISWCIDSFLFHTLAKGWPSQYTPPPKYMSNVKGIGQAANVHTCAEWYIE